MIGPIESTRKLNVSHSLVTRVLGRITTPELSGVADDEEAQRLAAEAVLRSRVTSRIAWLFSSILLAIVVGAIAVRLLKLSPIWFGVPAFFGFELYRRFLRRCLDRHLGQVLREHGRCAKCGYDRQGLGMVTCPECGTPSDSH